MPDKRSGPPRSQSLHQMSFLPALSYTIAYETRSPWHASLLSILSDGSEVRSRREVGESAVCYKTDGGTSATSTSAMLMTCIRWYVTNLSAFEMAACFAESTTMHTYSVMFVGLLMV